MDETTERSRELQLVSKSNENGRNEEMVEPELKRLGQKVAELADLESTLCQYAESL